MVDLNYKLYDVVELKKPHPCSTHSRQFQIVRVGADIKVKCLGCGNLLLLTRDNFNHRLRKIISSNDSEINLRL